jgi:DNA polymerase III delta prime subunit
MNTDLLLHPRTAAQIENLLANPSHALLIAGISGSGKKTVGFAIAEELLEVDKSKLEEHPYFLHIGRLKNKQDIAIEQVREVIAALKLKVPGSKKIQRVIFIEDAQYLSIPAQNALLKVLEEPSIDTVFLLSVNSVQNVLPTISSRAQILDLQAVALEGAKKYWGKEHTHEQIESAWRLSGGTVGLMSALLTEDQEHPLKESVQQARKFLGAKTYERLIMLDSLSRNKEQFGLFLDAMSRILNFLQRTSVKNNKPKQNQQILESRKILQKVQKALQANANTKMVALELALGLKV